MFKGAKVLNRNALQGGVIEGVLRTNDIYKALGYKNR
jgi:hypothetical protein